MKYLQDFHVLIITKEFLHSELTYKPSDFCFKDVFYIPVGLTGTEKQDYLGFAVGIPSLLTLISSSCM